jgi:hypothetical protein
VPVKYWEIIADNLHKAGWSYGYVSALDREGRTILDCGRTPRRRKAFHRAIRGNPDCVSRTGTGDSPIRGGFGLVNLHHSLKSPLCSCVSITLPASSDESVPSRDRFHRMTASGGEFLLTLSGAIISLAGLGSRGQLKNSKQEEPKKTPI